MGRHGHGPAPTRAIPGRRLSSASAAVLVGVVAVVFAVLTVLGLTLLGVPLLPRQEAVAAGATPSPTPTVDEVALASSPAQTTITTVLGPAPAAGWVPAGAVAWSGGTPFDASCGRPTTDAVLSGTRVYAIGRPQFVLTVSAYTAGSGAVAIRDWQTRLTSCASAPVTVTQPAVPTSDAFVVSVPQSEAQPGGTAQPGATAIFWRRGDVVAVLAVPVAGAKGMQILASQLDPALVRALTGVCANQASTVADAVRSPWVARDQFVGLASPIPVTMAPSPTPRPPSGITPAPVGWSPTPLPSVSMPVRPADPVWPEALPATEVGSPVPPSVLAPAPTLSVVPSRFADPVGPGCGWAFTGQTGPPYDPAAEAVAAQGRVAQAREGLSAAQQAWQANVVQYWAQVGEYTTQANAYTAYALAVRKVAVAWDRITAERTAYADAVERYNAAAAAREQFLLDQAAAQTDYDTAVAECLAASPSATPTASASPSATDPTAPQCPPPVPPILNQVAPTVPPLPTPPPDPRPTG